MNVIIDAVLNVRISAIFHESVLTLSRGPRYISTNSVQTEQRPFVLYALIH